MTERAAAFLTIRAMLAIGAVFYLSRLAFWAVAWFNANQIP